MSELEVGSVIHPSYGTRKNFRLLMKEILQCPTPGGSKYGGGWDTQSAAQRLYPSELGGVPRVPPLDALSRVRARTHTHTPEKIAVRGGTDGTLNSTARRALLPPENGNLSVQWPSPGGWDTVGHDD